MVERGDARDPKAPDENGPAAARVRGRRRSASRKKDKATREIRERILAGEFRTGDLVSENQLATALSLTRAPVRQALAKLEGEGLVEILPRRATRIWQGHLTEAHSLMSLRYAIEQLVVSVLARMRRMDFDELRAIRSRMEKIAGSGRPPTERDRGRFLEADIQFHAALAKLADFEPAGEFLRELIGKLRLVALTCIQTAEVMRKVIDEHDAIVSALKSGDEEAARKGVHDHLCNTARRWFPNVLQGPQQEAAAPPMFTLPAGPEAERTRPGGGGGAGAKKSSHRSGPKPGKETASA